MNQRKKSGRKAVCRFMQEILSTASVKLNSPKKNKKKEKQRRAALAPRS